MKVSSSAREGQESGRQEEGRERTEGDSDPGEGEGGELLDEVVEFTQKVKGKGWGRGQVVRHIKSVMMKRGTRNLEEGEEEEPLAKRRRKDARNPLNTTGISLFWNASAH